MSLATPIYFVPTAVINNNILIEGPVCSLKGSFEGEPCTGIHRPCVLVGTQAFHSNDKDRAVMDPKLSARECLTPVI